MPKISITRGASGRTVVGRSINRNVDAGASSKTQATPLCMCIWCRFYKCVVIYYKSKEILLLMACNFCMSSADLPNWPYKKKTTKNINMKRISFFFVKLQTRRESYAHGHQSMIYKPAANGMGSIEVRFPRKKEKKWCQSTFEATSGPIEHI